MFFLEWASTFYIYSTFIQYIYFIQYWNIECWILKYHIENMWLNMWFNIEKFLLQKMADPTCYLKKYVNCPNKGNFQLVGVERLRSSSERRGDDLITHLSSENDSKYWCLYI